MSELQNIEYNWRNFSADRNKARRQMMLVVEEKLEAANRLKEETLNMQRDFDVEWKERKESLAQARNEVVKAELRSGRSAQVVLKEMGSNNTVWIYKLRKEVMEEMGLGTPSGDSEAPPAEDDTPSGESGSGPVEDDVLQGVLWEHHDHTGTIGWLISTTRKYVKKYALEGSDYEGEFFVCDDSFSFVSGNREFFDRTPRMEIMKRSAMLVELLEGSYAGKIVLGDNPFRA